MADYDDIAIVGKFFKPVRDLVHRDVDGAGDCAIRQFFRLPDVQQERRVSMFETPLQFDGRYRFHVA